MSKVIASTLSLLLFMVPGRPQVCPKPGTIGWSEQQLAIGFACPFESVSPLGDVIVKVDTEQVMTISKVSGVVIFSTPNVGPAMLGWAPQKDTFYLNDGNGSGMSSNLRVFVYSSGRVREDDTFERLAVKDSRARYKCRSHGDDPNVWGLGWSKDARELFVMAQTVPSEGCGPLGAIRGYVFNAERGHIKDALSATQTKRRFRNLLPENVLNGR